MLTNFKKWPMESQSERMPKPPQLDHGVSDSLRESDGLVDSACGMILETMPQTVPASKAFTPEELERRIAMHAERVARRAQDEAKPKRKPATPAESYAARATPKDLKLVNCAQCGKTLLGESQEPLRVTKYRRYTLPQPVAARLHGSRPYCARCAANYVTP